MLERAVGGVECIAFSRAGLRPAAPHQMHVAVHIVGAIVGALAGVVGRRAAGHAALRRTHHVHRPVVRVVIDHPDMCLRKVAVQIGDGLADHGCLVATGHQEMPGEVGGPAGWHGFVPQVGDDDYVDVRQKGNAHGQCERLSETEQNRSVQCDCSSAALSFWDFG